MNVNVGCGEFPAPGWVNVDIHTNGPMPDLVGSILDLPIPDGIADRVYCGHVLEHVPLDDVPAALAEVRRILRAGGELMVVGPDLDRARTRHPHAVEPLTVGARRWHGDEHYWEATEELTVDLLQKAGYITKVIPIRDVAPPWPVVARVPWQCAVHAV